MQVYPSHPAFQICLYSVIYLCEPHCHSKLLGLFLHCPAYFFFCKYAPIYLCSPTNTFSSIYSFPLLSSLPPGPITAEEINKTHNSFWLLFFVTLYSNIYNNKETNLITKVITINKNNRERSFRRGGHVRGVIATGLKIFNLPAPVTVAVLMSRLGDGV